MLNFKEVTNKEADFFNDLFQQIVKADMSMHLGQKEAWLDIYKQPPSGEQLSRDILEGLGKNRYLALDEVCLEFHFKKRKVNSFWSRMVLAFQFMFTKKDLFSPFVIEICSASDRRAQHMKMRVKRQGNGALTLKSEKIEK